MKLLDNNIQTKKQIEQMFRDSQNIYLAVAFWGLGSSDLIKKVKDKKIKIICNLESGATNPFEIIKIGQLIGFKNIRSIENLHAKVYCADKKLILGSSNFSANGLSLEGDETNKLIEANLLVDNTQIVNQAKEWFNNLWKSARGVDEKYCKKFNDLWGKKRNKIRSSTKNQDFFEAFEDGAYSGEKFYIVIDTEEFTKEEETIGIKEAKAATKGDLYYAGRELYFWSDYQNVPREAYIISYFFDNKGKLSYEGIWKTLPKKYDRKDYQFCYKTNNRLILRTHINQIASILKQNSKILKIVDYGLEMKLSNFYKRFRSDKEL